MMMFPQVKCVGNLINAYRKLPLLVENTVSSKTDGNWLRIVEPVPIYSQVLEKLNLRHIIISNDAEP